MAATSPSPAKAISKTPPAAVGSPKATIPAATRALRPATSRNRKILPRTASRPRTDSGGAPDPQADPRARRAEDRRCPQWHEPEARRSPVARQQSPRSEIQSDRQAIARAAAGLAAVNPDEKTGKGTRRHADRRRRRRRRLRRARARRHRQEGRRRMCAPPTAPVRRTRTGQGQRREAEATDDPTAKDNRKSRKAIPRRTPPQPGQVQRRPSGRSVFPAGGPRKAPGLPAGGSQASSAGHAPAASHEPPGRTRPGQSRVLQEAGRSGPGASQGSDGQAEAGVVGSPRLDQGGSPEVPGEHEEVERLGPAARQRGRGGQEGLQRVLEEPRSAPAWHADPRRQTARPTTCETSATAVRWSRPAIGPIFTDAYSRSTAGQK